MPLPPRSTEPDGYQGYHADLLSAFRDYNPTAAQTSSHRRRRQLLGFALQAKPTEMIEHGLPVRITTGQLPSGAAAAHEVEDGIKDAANRVRVRPASCRLRREMALDASPLRVREALGYIVLILQRVGCYVTSAPSPTTRCMSSACAGRARALRPRRRCARRSRARVREPGECEGSLY
jgi:hypothetical protein